MQVANDAGSLMAIQKPGTVLCAGLESVMDTQKPVVVVWARVDVKPRLINNIQASISMLLKH